MADRLERTENRSWRSSKEVIIIFPLKGDEGPDSYSRNVSDRRKYN